MSDATISLEELQLAARNHAMPLEALRYPITPAGLHYVLVHYDVPAADAASWRLEVDGLVERSLSLSLDDLRNRPTRSLPVTMECAGNGRALTHPRAVSQPWLVEAVGTAEWTGTPLRGVLEEAGVSGGAVEAVFTGADRGVEGGVEQDYQRSLPLDEAMRDEVLLAWGMNGAPLPPQHGFPLRLLVPGWYGMTSVKWLRSISLVAEPFTGYQNTHSYRVRARDEEVGEPITRILPRALIRPPGIPEFMTRERRLAAGPCRLEGRAWSGRGRVVRVEVSADDGRSWSDAVVGEAPSPFAWAPWTFEWDAPAGEHVLSARATDETGAVQPEEAPWNTGSYLNNAVHRVRVVVS